mgnify:CR=1 FL=1
MIPLKSKQELQLIRESGKILARVMQRVKGSVKPGIATFEIDEIVEQKIREEGAVPAFKGYKGFPASVCVSLNEEVVHGIPGERIIVDGDIVSIDIGVNYKGYFSDAAVTLPVGKVSPKVKKLIEVTKRALNEGIRQARPGNRIFDISYVIQNYVEAQGFSVVRQFVGHGIGLNLHEDPEIPNFGRPNQGATIEPGMVLAIEPMVNMGSWECRILDNGWTAVTADNMPSAHFEHTIEIGDRGPLILTA